jgi:hypothetical protein
MEIEIIRNQFLSHETLSTVLIDGKEFCYALEDFDRGLDQSNPLSEIQSVKVQGETAIPSGRYKMVVSYSPRFGKRLPLLLNVPGFRGIRIHSGNYHNHTQGCILLGLDVAASGVYRSREAMTALMNRLDDVQFTLEVFVTIRRNYTEYAL